VSQRTQCEHARECAGCPLIDLSYAAQLDTKRERVASAAALYPTLANVAVESTAPAEPMTGYRVRAKLMVGARPSNAAKGPALGLFARAEEGAEDHRVVDIPGCQVLAPALLDVASRLRRLLASPPPETGQCLVAQSEGGILSAFDLREVVGETTAVLVTIVLATTLAAPENELNQTARVIQNLSPLIASVAVNYREPRAVQVLGATTRTLTGAGLARDRIGGLYRLAAHGSFTQAHREQAARIEDWIAAHSGEFAGRVLDVYGGSGALSLPLARRGAKVTLIESFRPAADCAEQAAREQGLDAFVVRCGDASNLLTELSRSRAPFDAVVANPPRRGMSPAVRSAIAALAPGVIAYVSCDPDTLCRDLDHFARLGYRAECLRPVDMIPLTDQVETVAFLRPAPPAPSPVVYEDDDLFVAETFAYDPAPPRGALAPAGSRATSGLVVGAKSSAIEGPLRSALTNPRANRTHLVLCRGPSARQGVVERRTEYRRLARVAGHSLLRVTIHGDRGARIERDLARIGHPVVGDTHHGHTPTNRHFEEKYGLDRPFLHCAKVEFDHPRTGARIVTEGRLPGELTMVLRRLGLLALDVMKEVMVG
jgi:23S rRNA (uracil1939-C5)-methyltransferase